MADIQVNINDADLEQLRKRNPMAFEMLRNIALERKLGEMSDELAEARNGHEKPSKIKEVNAK